MDKKRAVMASLDAQDREPASAAATMTATTTANGDSSSAAPLPPYSGPSASASASTPHRCELEPASSRKGTLRWPGMLPLDYRLYAPPLFELSADATTLLSKAEYLSTNADALASLVRAQAAVPPKPQLQVRGTRDGGHGVDFDVRLNLMSLLVPEDAARRMDYIRCVSDGERAFRGGTRPDTKPHVGDAGLDAWCRRYVKDAASVKSFALQRVVVNLDVSWLEGQLRGLVASLNYRGLVDVHFTLTHCAVVAQSPDRIGPFFTSVAALFAGKTKYQVVQAVWPFATTRSGEPGRQCVVQSEETWWREWRDPIKYAISQRRRGWVTVEDKLEVLMEGKGANLATINW